MKFHKIDDAKLLIRDREYLVARVTSGDHPMSYDIMKFSHLKDFKGEIEAVFGQGKLQEELQLKFDDVYELPQMPTQYWSQQKE
jgi:hypothetical protein